VVNAKMYYLFLYSTTFRTLLSREYIELALHFVLLDISTFQHFQYLQTYHQTVYKHNKPSSAN